MLQPKSVSRPQCQNVRNAAFDTNVPSMPLDDREVNVRFAAAITAHHHADCWSLLRQRKTAFRPKCRRVKGMRLTDELRRDAVTQVVKYYGRHLHLQQS